MRKLSGGGGRSTRITLPVLASSIVLTYFLKLLLVEIQLFGLIMQSDRCMCKYIVVPAGLYLGYGLMG